MSSNVSFGAAGRTGGLMSETDLYKLKLLNSVLPPLLPDLLPAPGHLSRSPSLAATSTRKRPGDSDSSATSPPPVTVGLGLGTRNEENIAKRARVTSTPTSILKASEKGLSSSLHAPTPELRSVVFSRARSPSNSTDFSPQISPRPLPQLNWKEQYPPERLNRLYNRYREMALDRKRLGDKVARENRQPKAHLHATVILADALLLYVFAFWCMDQASKKCHTSNWGTIFGLLSFVKSSAEKTGASVVVGVCLRIEAHIVQLLSANEQKVLAFRGGQLLLDIQNDSTQKGHHENSASVHELLKSYTKASGEIFRYQRSWEESAVALAPPILAASAPNVWRICSETSWNVDATTLVLPVSPWSFAWPVDLGRTMSIPHTVSFARAILEEWATSEGIQYDVPMVQDST